MPPVQIPPALREQIKLGLLRELRRQDRLTEAQFAALMKRRP